VLIIGVGNPDRSDDAAGLLVAQRLREPGVEAREHTGDPLALIDVWEGASEVIVIGTVVSGAAPGTLTSWDAVRSPLPTDQFCGSTHAFGLAETVEIARRLGRLPASLEIYGIEGAIFELGGSLSSKVAAAVERVAQEICVKATSCGRGSASGPRRHSDCPFGQNTQNVIQNSLASLTKKQQLPLVL
jgi:hydrogenase maturation protease